MSGLFRTTARQNPLPVDPDDARRPSHWNQDINEFEVDPRVEYPTETTDHPRELGFTPPPNPTPVYLTETPPADRTLKQWAAGNATLDLSPDQLSGADRRRKRMVVTNTGDTNAAYVTQRPSDLGFMGYLLEPNQSIEMFHNDQVWAMAAASTTVVTWLIEYELEES